MAATKLLNKSIVGLVHVAGWAAFLIYPFFNTPRFGPRGPGFGQGGQPPNIPMPGPAELDIVSLNNLRIPALVYNILILGFFYFNIYFLIPKLLIKKGWKLYALAVVAGFLSIYATHTVIRELAGFSWHRQPLSFSIFTFLTALALSTSLRLTSDRIKFEQEHKDRENENLKSELSFLRSQVSPHFMFNVLNSIAALARKKSDQLESAIIQLSQLMRYMLYESGDAKVTLEKEAEYLKSYIDLQKLRFGMDVAVRYNAEIENRETPIEPMLLIPFVENSFKHGMGMVTDPVIEIHLKADDHELNFIVRNKYNDSADQSKDESSGIGLANVQRRLDLLYKNLYILKTSGKDGWFVVELKLILS
jgi:sensor histidine kinase YesM